MYYYLMINFFCYFFYPYTLFLLCIFGLWLLFGYIWHKMDGNKYSVSYGNNVKKLFKIFLAIDLVPSILVLLSLLIFPKHSEPLLIDTYLKIDHLQRKIDIEGWVFQHWFYFTLIISFLISLILLIPILQEIDRKFSVKMFACYLGVSIPLICGLLYLMSYSSLLGLIVIIGAPGALLSMVRKGKL